MCVMQEYKLSGIEKTEEKKEIRNEQMFSKTVLQEKTKMQRLLKFYNLCKESLLAKSTAAVNMVKENQTSIYL